MSMMALAEKSGISYFVLRNRIARGWPVKEAISKPLGTALFTPRTAKGSGLPQAKIKEADVKNIRQMYAAGQHTMLQVALQFGISPAAVCLMVNKKTWAHVL
jgi:phosphopantetheinyl transferase (holo-ACP synthase)